MNYEERRNLAIKWLNGKRNFDEGISILESAAFKPAVIAILKRHGENGPSAKERLLFHMRTYVKLWFDNKLAEDTDLELGVVQGIEISKEDEKKRVPMFSQEMTERMNTMPEEVAMLVRKYRESYILRDKLYRELADMPEDNNEATKMKRKELSDKIEAETNMQDKLYIEYDGWFRNGKLEKPDPEPEKPKRVMLEDGLERMQGMDKRELRRLRKSIATKIARSKNMLDFQTETKQQVLNPMPSGTARIKYQSKIERLEGELKKVEIEIAKRA